MLCTNGSQAQGTKVQKDKVEGTHYKYKYRIHITKHEKDKTGSTFLDVGVGVFNVYISVEQIIVTLVPVLPVDCSITQVPSERKT